MGATEEIMAGIPIHDLAAQLGVDEATAEAATRQAIPAQAGVDQEPDRSGSGSILDMLGGLLGGGR